METYVMLTKLTDEGRKTLKQNPNRTKEVNKEIEGMAAGSSATLMKNRILGQYDSTSTWSSGRQQGPSRRSRWSIER